MTYLLLSLAVTVPVCIVALVVLGRGGRRTLVPALAGLAVLLVMTAVFDNVIVGSGIVAYDPDLILGMKVGVAPVEDFSYAIAAALGLPALWVALSGPLRRSGDPATGPGRSPDRRRRDA